MYYGKRVQLESRLCKVVTLVFYDPDAVDPVREPAHDGCQHGSNQERDVEERAEHLVFRQGGEQVRVLDVGFGVGSCRWGREGRAELDQRRQEVYALRVSDQRVRLQ